MKDFRNTQQFKNFDSCRSSQDKFINTIEMANQTANQSEVATVRRSAIEALAYNESCTKIAKTIDFSGTPDDLRAPALEALLSYKKRTDLENSVLTSILSNQPKNLGQNTAVAISYMAVENNQFNRLQKVQLSEGSNYNPLWAYLVVMILLFALIRTYLNTDSQKKSEGLLSFAAGTVKGIFAGLKSDYSEIRRKFRRDDGDRDV